MAAGRTPCAPKQWQLTRIETVSSFESWRANLVYTLSLDNNFAPFLVDGFTWQKKSNIHPNRGLANDGADVQEAARLTAAQKSARLDLLLGYIANYCTVISRNAIIKGSTSLGSIWQLIRQHYGFQNNGARFLDLAEIKIQTDERPEDLYQRFMAFFEDNLLTTTCGINHHGAPVQADEDLTPTLENTVVLMWLQAVNPGLPQLVKQRYGAELRNKSLASLKPEISQALPSLLDELRFSEDTKAFRTGSGFSAKRYPTEKRNRTTKFCVLCKTAGRPSCTSHNLSACKFLPESDRKYMARSRLITDGDDIDDPSYEDDFEESPEKLPSALLDTPASVSAHRVQIVQSPYLNAFFNDRTVRLTLDTGATTNMILASFARSVGFQIKPASQDAFQADGVSPLEVVGEVHCTLQREGHSFQLDGLVIKCLDVDILAGNPFLKRNDIAIRPAKSQIVIGGSEIVSYGPQPSGRSYARRTQAFLLRAPSHQTVLMPGDVVQLDVPEQCDPDSVWALEPRLDSPLNKDTDISGAWPPPQEVDSIGHSIRLTNATDEPIILKKSEHVCQIRAISTVDTHPSHGQGVKETSSRTHAVKGPHSSGVKLDPDDCLPNTIRNQFLDLHAEFDDTFSPSISKYNGVSGDIKAVVNIGPTMPPQRKGRMPQYKRDLLLELQNKCDELEDQGVLAKPEQVGVNVEYLNLSFLVRKPSGGSRLVTAFGEVGRYAKPQPSLMPNVDSVLRDIGKWRYIITTDLLQSFYQLPLAQSSMKFCGIATPFKGIRVYTRCAMGMPGSETCLEEIMSRVLGELIQEGFVVKIADDLYCGGGSPEEVLTNWRRVLTALRANNLRLSAVKTVICPTRTNILGWVWSNGTLRASPHKLSSLASVDPPRTVQGLRAFVGAYKVLSRVLHGSACLLDPLDQATAGKQSRDLIVWTDQLHACFSTAQEALKDSKAITIPRPGDHIWIVTDASNKSKGLGATLYVLREGKLLLAGFYNAKLKKHQLLWLPCEIEALCIGSAIKHFAPFITQSSHKSQVLTDSQPCVQSYARLCRGEFSSSSRVTTFLSVVARYQVDVRHISGAANLPSDYTSRNPVQCDDGSCQICKFVDETAQSVIRSLSVHDVTSGSTKMPFTNRATWLATQLECPDLRRVHAHLTHGTRPTKKETKIPDVKRYLKETSVSRDGLLVVTHSQAFQPLRERIVVPRSVLDGLLTAIHIRFNHPSRHQSRQLFGRYFFALDLDRALQSVDTSCHHCNALRYIPPQFSPQTTSTPPEHLGATFAADVIKRYKQLIFVLRETVSAFTLTAFIPSEKHEDLRGALLSLCADVRSLGDCGTSIRVDPAPGFTALSRDAELRKFGITLEIGSVKNKNKNPIAEKAIEELGLEVLKISPEGGPLTGTQLALATANMNARIRLSGLSARELWTQRDQISGEQLPIDDRQIVLCQHWARIQNHQPSSKSKSGGRHQVTSEISPGDLVYLKQERDKCKARDKYMVVSVLDQQCKLRKFIRSQFRAKIYDVKLTDCYPVLPTTLDGHRGRIRGLDQDTEEEDIPFQQQLPSHALQDAAILPPLPLPPPPPIPYAISCQPEKEGSCAVGDIPTVILPRNPPDDLADVLPEHTSPFQGASPLLPVRRSGRERKPPAWQLDSQWSYD